MPDVNGRYSLEPREGSYINGFYRVSDFELATGWVGGFDPRLDPGDVDVTLSPRQGFESALLPALLRPPCIVGFSGGRDSTAILMVATQIARREGLPDPVPATLDFTGRGLADETYYQELVLKELGLEDWVRLRDVDAFDVLGERARAGLRRYGLLYPALLHGLSQLAELASGGSVMVGEGGDEMLGAQRMTSVTYVVKARHRPGRRTLRRLSDALAPRSIRQSRIQAELTGYELHPWLAPELADEFVTRQARCTSMAPLRWDRAVLRCPTQRGTVVSAANLQRVFDDFDVSYHAPFLDPAFCFPFARAGGPIGWTSRTAMMRMLFGDIVPDEICRRDSKARFSGVAVGGSSRTFLRDWSGEGVDASVIDIEAFRRAATVENPLFGTQMLLQAAWLAVDRRRESQIAERVS